MGVRLEVWLRQTHSTEPHPLACQDQLLDIHRHSKFAKIWQGPPYPGMMWLESVFPRSGIGFCNPCWVHSDHPDQVNPVCIETNEKNTSLRRNYTQFKGSNSNTKFFQSRVVVYFKVFATYDPIGNVTFLTVVGLTQQCQMGTCILPNHSWHVRRPRISSQAPNQRAPRRVLIQEGPCSQSREQSTSKNYFQSVIGSKGQMISVVRSESRCHFATHTIVLGQDVS